MKIGNFVFSMTAMVVLATTGCSDPATPSAVNTEPPATEEAGSGTGGGMSVPVADNVSVAAPAGEAPAAETPATETPAVETAAVAASVVAIPEAVTVEGKKTTSWGWFRTIVVNII